MQYLVPSPAEMRQWIGVVRAKVWPQAEEFLGKDIMDTVRDNASTPQ